MDIYTSYYVDRVCSKYKTELTWPKTQYNNKRFVDKLFKSVFKSWGFEKHASINYYKLHTFLLLLI